MSEIICHDLAKVKDPVLFREDARLASQGLPSRAFKALVIEAFGLAEDAIAHSCSQAYLQPAGFCTKGDVAFLRKLPGHQLQVCNVWMHVEVNSQVFSLVSMWDVLEVCDLHWYATVEQKHDAEFIPTKDLACCPPYMNYEGKTFRVLVPLQMR